jgi:hypothetical protein
MQAKEPAFLLSDIELFTEKATLLIDILPMNLQVFQHVSRRMIIGKQN